MAQGATPSILGYLRSLSAKEALRDVPDGDLLRRFTAEHDEAAFAVLVRRHGGMVLHVCRGLLANEADADDAFQATFLVLAHRARSVRNNGSLGGWLYGVAYRTALKARAASATRKRHEARAGAGPRPEAVDELTWREAQWIIHQELARLPEKYRAPLVLCYLQGKQQDEAARVLGWPPGRLRSMLERARDLLRKRLLRRGLGPAAVLVASAGFGQAVAAAPPGPLLAGAARAAATWTAGRPEAGVVSAPVARLAEDVVRTMSTGKVTLAFGGLLVAAALGLGVRDAADLAAGARARPRVVRASLPHGVPASPEGRANRTRLKAGPVRKVRVRVRASGSWDQHTPDRAFDGAADTMWNAGDYAPQWIEADLGSATRLDTLVLHMTQLPAGATTHEVWLSDEAIGADHARAKLVHTFHGHTDDNQRLALRFPRGLCARHVQIRTTRSPSWVAWLEVELRVQRPDGRYLCRGDPAADHDRRADPQRDIATSGRYGPVFLHVEAAPSLLLAPDTKTWAPTLDVRPPSGAPNLLADLAPEEE
jgi:RNA polymerase sigma factor (sigma-70 family)